MRVNKIPSNTINERKDELQLPASNITWKGSKWVIMSNLIGSERSSCGPRPQELNFFGPLKQLLSNSLWNNPRYSGSFNTAFGIDVFSIIKEAFQRILVLLTFPIERLQHILPFHLSKVTEPSQQIVVSSEFLIILPRNSHNFSAENTTLITFLSGDATEKMMKMAASLSRPWSLYIR